MTGAVIHELKVIGCGPLDMGRANGIRLGKLESETGGIKGGRPQQIWKNDRIGAAKPGIIEGDDGDFCIGAATVALAKHVDEAFGVEIWKPFADDRVRPNIAKFFAPDVDHADLSNEFGVLAFFQALAFDHGIKNLARFKVGPAEAASFGFDAPTDLIGGEGEGDVHSFIAFRQAIGLRSDLCWELFMGFSFEALAADADEEFAEVFWPAGGGSGGEAAAAAEGKGAADFARECGGMAEDGGAEELPDFAALEIGGGVPKAEVTAEFDEGLAGEEGEVFSVVVAVGASFEFAVEDAVDFVAGLAADQDVVEAILDGFIGGEVEPGLPILFGFGGEFLFG
jgi:hypothetical protein